MKNLSKISVIATLLLPSFAFAKTFEDIVKDIGKIITAAIPVIMALGFAYFLWGVVKYIMAGADDAGKQDAKKMMINGIIGLFVMVAVWGIVGVISSTFLGPGQTTTYEAPKAPGAK